MIAARLFTSPRALRFAGFALALLGAQSAAQAQFYAGTFYAPIIVPRAAIPYPSMPRPLALHPSEIFEELRERGFEPLGITGRRGEVYLVDAIGARREHVRLVVDAYDGEILERFARTNPNTRLPQPELKKQTSSKPLPGATAAQPTPPRRPVEPSTSKPQIVAPARPASDWAPINAVPVAPLD